MNILICGSIIYGLISGILLYIFLVSLNKDAELSNTFKIFFIVLCFPHTVIILSIIFFIYCFKGVYYLENNKNDIIERELRFYKLEHIKKYHRCVKLKNLNVKHTKSIYISHFTCEFICIKLIRYFTINKVIPFMKKIKKLLIDFKKSIINITKREQNWDPTPR